MKFRNLLLWGLICSLTKNVDTLNSLDEVAVNEISETISLLNHGEREIQLSENYKDINLVLGNSGAGKKTFIQWFAGDNERLHSKQEGHNIGEYSILDENGGIRSIKVYPELTINNDTDSAYYVCPGFTDNQTVSQNVATTYFIKKVADHAERIKLVFVVPYQSVKFGSDHVDFMKLLSHATNLIKNIERYQESIGIVVTKVDNMQFENGNNDNLKQISIRRVKKIIGDFLEEIKINLTKKLKFKTITESERLFYNKAKLFVEILLTKNKEDYIKIGLFGRPNAPGLISKISHLQDEKENIRNLLFINMKFVEREKNDLAYTVSEESKSTIKSLVEEMNKNVKLNIQAIIEDIRVHHRNKTEPTLKKIGYLASNAKAIKADQLEVKKFRDDSIKGREITTRLIKEVKNVSATLLAERLKNVIDDLGVMVTLDQKSFILNYGKYFEFFQVVSDKVLVNRQDWTLGLIPIKTYFSDILGEIQKDVKNSVVKIHGLIESSFANTTKIILDHYTEITEFTEVKKLSTEFKKGYYFILKWTQMIETYGLFADFQDKYLDLQLKISKNTNIILGFMKYLKFLQTISFEKLDIWSQKFIASVHGTADYLYESSRWNEFLNNLYQKLSKYDIQKVRNRKELLDQSLIQSYTRKFFQFKNQTGNNSKVQKNDSQARDLELLANLTLENRNERICISSKLVIRGDFIKFSDLVDAKGVLKIFCKANVSEVNIFALNSVFIDANLNAVGKGLILIIFAPRLEVIGERTIDLSGADGQPHKPQKANLSKLGDQINGDHGKPGLPGGASGSLYGICVELINRDLLNISVNGGKGGPGQHGGDGAPGKFGERLSLDPEYYHSNFYCETVCEEISKKFLCNTYYSDSLGHVINLKSEKGTAGGNGGNGGEKGREGPSGQVTLIILGNDSILSFRGKRSPGIKGKGGLGGPGGSQPTGISLACNTPSFSYWYEYFEFLKTTEGTKYPSGKNGVDGANYENIQYPPEEKGIDNKAGRINDFKTYLRKSINSTGWNFRKGVVMNMCEMLNDNRNVKRTEDTFALYKELIELENQYTQIRKDDLLIFYQHLLLRISEYAKDPKPHEKSDVYKGALGYLYTAALSKVLDLKKTDLDTPLIINVQGFLDKIIENINILKNLQDKQNKVDLINRSKEDYKRNIDAKIEEAKNLINNEITPFIDQTFRQIEDNIDKLVSEIKELQKYSEENREKLSQKRKECQDNLVLRGIFSALKAVSVGLSFVPGVGGAIGGFVGSVATMTESFVIKDSDNPIDSITIPEGITDSLEKLESGISDNAGQKIANFQKQLVEISEEIKNSPALNELSANIEDAKNKVSQLLDNSGGDFQVFDEIEKVEKLEKIESKLKEDMSEKESELESKKDELESKSESALVIVRKVNQLVRVAAVGIDIYNKFKNDVKDIELISEAIKKEEKNLQSLREFEGSIYKIVAPQIKQMKGDFENLRNTLKTKSHVALDVTKWQVQRYLKDLKLKMQQFTKQLAVQEDFVQCIEKLEEVMTTLINVYNRIQDSQDDQNLANYIAAVSGFNTDDLWTEKLEKLEIIISSNMIIEKYRAAINAVKQWVFPFASSYLENIKLPRHLKIEAENVAELASRAAIEIRLLKSRIQDYRQITIQEQDELKNSGYFNSQHASSHPFYIWKSNEYKDVIAKLLNGNSIVVKADVTRSAPEKDAIKFNKIEINFSSSNKTLQKEVNDKLRHFRIKATHLGNSYFRFEDKYYVLSSPSQQIEYSFEKDEIGIPISKNDVYTKIESGDILLSPYAMWKFQLQITSTEASSFEELKMYEGEVDLELVGKGTYVNRANHTNCQYVKDYYRPLSSLSVMDNLMFDQRGIEETDNEQV